MSDSVRAKLFAWDLDAWNTTWYVYAATPVLAVLGVAIGASLSGALGVTAPGEALVTAACVGVTILAGYALLAVVD